MATSYLSCCAVFVLIAMHLSKLALENNERIANESEQEEPIITERLLGQGVTEVEGTRRGGGGDASLNPRPIYETDGDSVGTNN